jgi:hypothetical protein
MSRILELQNSANFSLQYSNSIPAVVIEMIDGKDIYAKLTDVIIPVIFDRSIISVAISTTVPIGKLWRGAGSISKVVPTGIGDSFSGSPKYLKLGQRNLVQYEDNTANYTLIYSPPRWFRDVTIGIYQYEGPDTSAIEIDLTNIESKIDALSPQG